ncbi:MAG: type II secretion system F family protein [Candidatus Hadarchaeales archaeon]
MGLFCLFLFLFYSPPVDIVERRERAKQKKREEKRGDGKGKPSVSGEGGKEGGPIGMSGGLLAQRLKEYGVDLNAEEIVVIVLVGVFVLFVILLGLFRVLWVAALFSPIVGGLFIWLLTISAGERRKNALNNQMITFLDNYYARLQGGVASRQAFLDTYRFCPFPLKAVLEPAYSSLNSGKSFLEAISDADRNTGGTEPALHFFAEAIRIQGKTGGEIEDVVRSVKDNLRAQHMLRQQLKTKVASQLWVARFMSMIVPASFLLLFFWKRDLVSILLSDVLGIFVLTLAAFLTIGGLFLVNKLVVEVRKII